MEKWREKISRWKFDRKMQALITIALMITTLIFSSCQRYLRLRL